MLKDVASTKWGLPILGIVWFGLLAAFAFALIPTVMFRSAPVHANGRDLVGLLPLGLVLTGPAAVLGGSMARRMAASGSWWATFLLGVLWVLLGGFFSGFLLPLHHRPMFFRFSTFQDCLVSGAGVVMFNFALFGLPYFAGGFAAMFFRFGLTGGSQAPHST